MIVLELKWVLFALVALLIGLTALIMAVHQRRLRPDAEGQLEALKPLADGAVVGVMALERGQLTYANSPARHLLRLPAQGEIEATWMQPLRMDIAALQGEAEAQAGAAVRGRSRTLTLSDGATLRWWVVLWKRWTLVFVSDVSAQQQLEQAARALISDLAHELRTPLATLLTHLEIMQLPDVSNDVRSQSILFMRDETQRLVRLTNNALELGRLEATLDHSPTAVDLAALVAGAVAQVTHEAQRKTIDLVTTVGTDLPPAWGQPDQLKQVFLNLLDNAIKYCRAHDTVTVAVVLEETGLQCSVCDTGPGIDAQHRANVARRFYRGAPSGVSGSGLGLALVVEILRRHGSELQIESRTVAESNDPFASGENEPSAPSSGTCIRFQLPLAGGGNT